MKGFQDFLNVLAKNYCTQCMKMPIQKNKRKSMTLTLKNAMKNMKGTTGAIDSF
jgi:hypothetical protein